MRNNSSRRAKLGCELLEGRDCPAGQISVFAGVMIVTGDGGANAVAVTDDGAGTVTATIDGTTRAASGIRAVVVNTGGGDDTIAYTLTGKEQGLRVVTVNAGTGNDRVTLDARPGVSGLFTFAAAGGADADVLSARV